MLTRSRYRWTELYLLLLPAAFLIVSLIELELAPTVKDGGAAVRIIPPLQAFTPAIGLMLALAAAHILLCIFAPDADQTLLPIVGILTSIGVIMALRIGRDLGRGFINNGNKQLLFALVGLLLCVGTVRLTRNLAWIRNYKYTWAAFGLALVVITLVRGARSFSTDAPSRDVLTIGGGLIAFQPSEIVKICLVVFFAGYLSENAEMLAAGGINVGPFRLPPLKQLGPLLAMLGISLLIVVGVRELGLALMIFGFFLSMLYVASNRFGYVVGGLGLFAVGALIAISIFSYARERVSIVANAFDPEVYQRAGYQIVQGLVAFGSGGLFGAGLGLGHPTLVPVADTDFVAAAFGEEFGFAGMLALLALFMLLVYRGMHIAVNARDGFNKLLAVGLTSVFAIQTMVILCGNLKIMPLTGVPLPFVAYGGSSLIANFIIVGLLLRLSEANT